MNDTVLIFLENHHQTDSFPALEKLGGYRTVFILPEQTVSPETGKASFLALCPDASSDPAPRLATSKLPLHIPALVLGSSPAPPPYLSRGDSSRLIDYYGGELQLEELTARVHFLRKVEKVSRERESYLQHHQNFLDWYASRDGLTGLYNRHHFNRLAPERFNDAEKSEAELSLVLFDIDYFNDINKSCGRSFGDFVLNELAARLTRSTRQEDFCFRISGGEFAVLLPLTGLAAARTTGKAILDSCTGKVFARNSISRRVSLSVGIASKCDHQPASFDELVTMAETALFKAKAEGRSRIYTYAPWDTSGMTSAQSSFGSVKVAINRLLDKTRSSTISSLQILARDIAGPAHKEHLDRVSKYIELLCTSLGLTTPIIKTLQNAATLHSSIRHLIHNDLLAKEEKFSREDLELLRDFPHKLSEIIDIFDYFSQERLVLLTRTEKFDGSGYPDGLKGDEIPLGARIIAVVDAFAAMTASRPHRPQLDPDTVLQELKNQAGSQFDPLLVIRLLEIIEKHELLRIDRKELSATLNELHSVFNNRRS